MLFCRGEGREFFNHHVLCVLHDQKKEAKYITYMTMSLIESLPEEWHDGEKYMHALLHVPESENPTSPGLTPYGSHLVMRSPLLALGVLDGEGRPWTTIIGGEPAFMRPLGRSLVGIRTLVSFKHDPVLELLRGSRADEAAREPTNAGRIIAGLPIDLSTRNRVKLSGRLIPGQLGFEAGKDCGVGEIQMIFKVETSLGMEWSSQD